MAIADRTGTVQNAQTHPRVADGFDKVILLDDDTMKPTLGKKHSEGANLSPGSDPEINGLLTKSLSRCKFLQLICEYGLQPLGCQRSKDSNLDTGYGKLLKFRRSLGRKIMPDREWDAGITARPGEAQGRERHRFLLASGVRRGVRCRCGQRRPLPSGLRLCGRDASAPDL
jgi:hypothetical protein